jgi:flavin reductase
MTIQEQQFAEAFRSGMRKLVSGVSLITSTDGTQRVGLIATAVNSVSVAPPTLLICVNQQASAHDVIRNSGIAAINILRSADREIADSFSDSSRRDERFMKGDWRTLATRAPILETSLVAFDCKVVRSLEHHSHTIFLLEAIDVWTTEKSCEALIYANKEYRTMELQTTAL